MAQRKVRRAKRNQSGETQASPAYRPEKNTRKDIPTTVARRTVTTEEELREEYAYVIKDLRRMVLIAAGMFILLIILGLVL